MKKSLRSSLVLLLVLAGLGAARADVSGELRQLSRAYIESGKTADRTKLLEYAKTAPSADLRGLAHFVAGMGDYEAGAYSQAAEELKQADGAVGNLDDYARYYHARGLVEGEDFQRAAGLLADFPARFPNSRLAPDAVRLRVESLIRSEKTAEAQKVLGESERILSAPVRLFLLARTQVLTGNLQEAVRTYRRVYYQYPLSDQADPSEDALNQLRRQMGKSYPGAPSSWRLQRGDVLFSARRYSDAHTEYRLATAGLKGADRDRARVRVGASDYGRLRTTAAYQWLSGLKVQDPKADAERLYYLGECARRLKRITEFAETAEELGRKHPQSPWYEEALFSLGNYYLLENDARRYREYYDRVAREFPKGKYAALAHWKVCWRAYLDKDPRAAALFREHMERYPKSPNLSGAAYWLGRLAEANGEFSTARALYTGVISNFPHYYYAYKANERLAGLGAGGDDDSAPPPYLTNVSAPRSLAGRPSAETQRLIGRADVLHALGLSELAEKELASGDYRKADAHWLGLKLAAQTAERGQFHRGLRHMKRYGFGYLRLPIESMPREYWESLFPLPYADELRARAATHRLDPHIVAGLIRQESEFNPGARSRAGARGLMQIMPSTGRQLARQAGLRGFSTGHLYTAALSLRLGTLHFRKVLDQFQGRLEYALAAYNAGEHRVEKWLTWGDFEDPEAFVETIPFTETRGYVQAVLRNAEVYRRIYSQQIAEDGTTPSRASLLGQNQTEAGREE